MATVLGNPQLMDKVGNTPTNSIPYWGYYSSLAGGGGYADFDPTNTQSGQQFLNAIHKYDPDAKFVGQELGGEGGSGNVTYSLQADQSKMPWNTESKKNNVPGMIDMNKDDFNPMYYGGGDASYSEDQFNQKFHHSFDSSQLYKPSDVGNDPILGSVTSSANLKPQGTSMLDILGPLAVGGFGMLAGGGGALASMLQKAPQMINSAVNGQFNPMQLASVAAPFIPGASAVMPYLGAASAAYQVAHGNYNPVMGAGLNAVLNNNGGGS